MVLPIPNDYALANTLIRFYGLRYTKEFTVDSLNLYMFYFLVRICKEHQIKDLKFCNDILFKEDGPLFDRFHFKNSPQLVPIDFETGLFIHKPKNTTKEYYRLISDSYDRFYRVFKGKDHEKILHELIKVPEEDLLSCYKEDLAIKNIRLKERSFYHTSYEDKYISIEDFTIFQLPEKLAKLTINEVIFKKYSFDLNTNQKILIQEV